MRTFWSNSSSEGVVVALAAVKLIFRKTGVERIAVVEFRMNKSSRDGTGNCVVQRRADASKIASKQKASF